jgi:mannan endo-1,4-beta-mannosidase
MFNSKLVVFILVVITIFSCTEKKNEYIKVENGNFILDEKEYSFIGSNYWQGMNLGAPESGDRSRLIRELDFLQSMGVTNLRVLAASEADEEMKYCIHPALQTAPGIYNEDLWEGLDFLLAEMDKRDMTAVMVLGNFWTWSGGFPQYLKWVQKDTIPFPQDPNYSWQNFTDYSKQFYLNEEAQELMDNHIKTVINRTNSITNIQYKNDPTIMSWQLANEPRGYDIPKDFRAWTKRTAKLIKSLDKNHLVCLGTEGNTSGKTAGVNVLLDNDNPDIDYITMHIWAQNWSWFNPTLGEEEYKEAIEKVDNYWNDHIKVAKKLNKPIVLEEFGIARDNSSYDPNATAVWRDRFFAHLFNKVTTSIKEGSSVRGLNFWTYSGEGKPPRPGEFWKKGDVFLGDPPHELQGWYGIYNSDASTLELIKKFSSKLNE